MWEGVQVVRKRSGVGMVLVHMQRESSKDMVRGRGYSRKRGKN